MYTLRSSTLLVEGQLGRFDRPAEAAKLVSGLLFEGLLCRTEWSGMESRRCPSADRPVAGGAIWLRSIAGKCGTRLERATAQSLLPS